jgi:hypothetical protein
MLVLSSPDCFIERSGQGTNARISAFMARLPQQEPPMNKVIERVMQTFGLMRTMDENETEQTREVLLDFLSKRPGTDERAAAVEGLTFLKNLKT